MVIGIIGMIFDCFQSQPTWMNFSSKYKQVLRPEVLVLVDNYMVKIHKGIALKSSSFDLVINEGILKENCLKM